mgnify:CR=1 FL=1
MNVKDLSPPHLDDVNAVVDVVGAICWFGLVGPFDCNRGVPRPA